MGRDCRVSALWISLFCGVSFLTQSPFVLTGATRIVPDNRASCA